MTDCSVWKLKFSTSFFFDNSCFGPIPFFQDMLEKAQPLSPRALVVDSIQTVYLQGVAGSAGSITQV